MKKKYVVEFTELSGTPYEFEFLTEDIEKAIQEYGMTKQISSHRILKESNAGKKQMLFG